MNKLVKLVVALAVASIFAGCQTATQPGRANTQTTTLDENSVLLVDQSVRNASSAMVLPAIPPEGYSTKAFSPLKELLRLQQAEVEKRASENERTYGDVFTQNQMIENSGTESNSTTATSTPTTTVPIDVAWGTGSAATTSGFVSGVQTVWGMLTGDKGTTNTPNATALATSTAAATNATTTKAGECVNGECKTP